jgi:hypothetical protein
LANTDLIRCVARQRTAAFINPRRLLKAFAVPLVMALCVAVYASDITAKEKVLSIAEDPMLEVPETLEPEEPIEVAVGTYITEITSLNLAAQSYRMRFWIWFRWPVSSTGFIRNPLDTFDVVGGSIESKSNIFQEKFDDGTLYGVAQVEAVVRQAFDVRAFPLDSYHLTLRVQPESDSDYVRYVSDGKNSKLDTSLSIPGWRLKDIGARVVEKKFDTSFGYEPSSRDTPGYSEYSEYQYSIGVSRPSGSVFFKTFWATFLSVLLAFLMLTVPPREASVKFTLGVGAVFSATANYYVITSGAPATEVMTLADSLSFFSVFVILVAISYATFSLNRFADDVKRAASFELRAGGRLAVLYVIGLIGFLYVHLAM